MKEKKEKMSFAKINNYLIIALFVTLAASVGALLYNASQLKAMEVTAPGGSTLATDSAAISNKYYSIGNNPTEIEKTYFAELTEAVEAQDAQATGLAVAKCFVTEHYTWTSKDNGYEVGGMSYIFTDDVKRSNFENNARWNFYSDLDLYIEQYGRENLIQVKEVTAQMKEPVNYLLTLQVENPDPTSLEVLYEDFYFDGYTYTVTWTYEPCSVPNMSEFQTSADITVVNHNGRMEIVAITSGEEE